MNEYTEDDKKNMNTDKFEHYYGIYDMYFNSIKNNDISLLEIGVKKGESLRLWKDYFPNAEIWGVDINPPCKNEEEERVNVVIGDQNEIETFNKIDKEFDVIIDDGSHVYNHMINSFCYTWSKLKLGGLYFIEDTAMTFHESFVGHQQDRNAWDSFIAGNIRALDLDTFSDNLIRKRIDSGYTGRANYQHSFARNMKKFIGVDVENFRNEILFIHHYCNLLVIKKKNDVSISAFDHFNSNKHNIF